MQKEKENWCEIFKTGIHQDSKGNIRKWTLEDLKTIESNFNEKNKDVPMCCGHPKTNSPAYGWIDKLKIQGGKLYASFKDVQDEFKTAVNKGLFKTRSISLTPDLMLRHIAFLGGQAPAIKGLESFCFQEDTNEIIIEFEDESQSNDEDKSPKGEPYGNDGAIIPADLKNKGVQMSEEELNNLQKTLEEKDKKIADLEAELKKQKEEKLTKEFEDFCDKAIEEGHILPVQKPDVISILQACNDTNFNFSASEEKNAAEKFKNFIGSLKQIDFQEIAEPNKVDPIKAINFSDANEIANAIIETQSEYSKKGIELNASEALNKIVKE